ncbi:hypothetical protein S40285_03112 [Stachybotrys chlorohalonatus IBT 40285]|uniref:RING-type E3 ubiquitin transferase n=1 Tax=Stachybotrys chlorohalonatus (strain IBT 40285) TaxID=1283841 RepID=A0A084QMA8_STAC4|nr:hypothetical protein S40285_03112 [Stachybotrys chlorohalonata IBT 40285]
MASVEGAGSSATRGDGGSNNARGESARGKGRSRGRGRGGGGGGGDGGQQARGGGNSGQRRGRGGGGRGGHQRGSSQDNSLRGMPANPAAQDVAAAAATAALRARLDGTAQNKAAETPNGEEEDTDGDVCFICANPVAHWSVAPCNHATCHICGLRMRALYKTKDCAHCRTPASFVIFTDDAEKRFELYNDADITSTDTNIGIKYCNEDIVGDTVLLLRYNCPDPSCDFAGLGWPDLHRHVKSTHRKRMCDLCTRNKKVFTHEHELFTDKELEKHMRHGDDKPGSADQTGFKGHPLCGFCGERFYDDDKLYEHCRMKHERCFICDRRDSRKPHYYMDYNALEEHFKKDHYLCSDRECMEKKFVVFESEMDLQAHQISDHAGKNVGRDARMVDMSGFDIRSPYQGRDGDGRGGRGGRGGRTRGGRGPRDTSDDGPLAVRPQTQNLRRDELAFQRQMAIHSAQSVTNRTFGGQLTAPSSTTPASSSSRSPRPGNAQAPAAATSSSTPTTDHALTDNLLPISLSAMTITDPSNLSAEERARVVRHSSVIERAANLLGNDPLKMSRFREHVSSFRRGTFTAPQVIDAFFMLFADSSSNALGTLVRELADLFDDKKKGDDLRKAWMDWRAINEDYPSLPGLSGMQGATSSDNGSGWVGAAAANPAFPQASPAQGQKHSTRVLKLKNSTRLGGPAPVSAPTRGPPGWVSAAASSSSNARGKPSTSSAAFPSLPSSSSAGSSRPSWIGSASQSQTSTPPPSSFAAAPSRSRDAFPALPSAPKPTTTIFGYGGGRAVRRDYGVRDSGFQWGSSAGSSAAPTPPTEEAEDGEDGAGGKGKKPGKNKKKQVLVQWG